MKLLGPDRSELMNVAAIERDGADLVIKGKVFGTMPMTARLSPAEARNVFKLINLKLVLFIITLPFRGQGQK